jgi:hypothetical protein
MFIIFLAVGAMIMLQSSGVETGLVILPVIDTTVARHKVEFSLFHLLYPVLVVKLYHNALALAHARARIPPQVPMSLFS